MAPAITLPGKELLGFIQAVSNRHHSATLQVKSNHIGGGTDLMWFCSGSDYSTQQCLKEDQELYMRLWGSASSSSWIWRRLWHVYSMYTGVGVQQRVASEQDAVWGAGSADHGIRKMENKLCKMCLMILLGVWREAPIHFREVKMLSAAACCGWSPVRAIFIKWSIRTDLSNQLANCTVLFSKAKWNTELLTGSWGKQKNTAGVQDSKDCRKDNTTGAVLSRRWVSPAGHPSSCGSLLHHAQHAAAGPIERCSISYTL